MIGKEGGEGSTKDLHYFITSVVSAFTAFTTWQTIKNQYYIFQKRQKINQIEKNDIEEVDELLGKGKRVNDVVLVKVQNDLFRDKLEQKMERKYKLSKGSLDPQSMQSICLILKPCTQMTPLRKKTMSLT